MLFLLRSTYLYLHIYFYYNDTDVKAPFFAYIVAALPEPTAEDHTRLPRNLTVKEGTYLNSFSWKTVHMYNDSCHYYTDWIESNVWCNFWRKKILVKLLSPKLTYVYVIIILVKANNCQSIWLIIMCNNLLRNINMYNAIFYC